MSLCDRDQLLPEVREAVPKNEKIQWTGRPEWKSFAYQSFGLKYLIAYFVISGLYVAASMDQSFVLRIFLTNFIPFVVSGFLAGTILIIIAYIEAAHTYYILTERRVILKSGVALVFVLHAPFSKIASIDRQNLAKGRGNIAFSMGSGKRIPYLSCWPSVKPWTFMSPIPSFRSIKDVAEVELLLVKIANANLNTNSAEPKTDKVIAI